MLEFSSNSLWTHFEADNHEIGTTHSVDLMCLRKNGICCGKTIGSLAPWTINVCAVILASSPLQISPLFVSYNRFMASIHWDHSCGKYSTPYICSMGARIFADHFDTSWIPFGNEHKANSCLCKAPNRKPYQHLSNAQNQTVFDSWTMVVVRLSSECIIQILEQTKINHCSCIWKPKSEQKSKWKKMLNYSHTFINFNLFR